MKKYSKILCFDEYTSVKTKKGNILIKDVVPGMEVISYDYFNNLLYEEKVIATAQSLHNTCAILAFENGTTIKCTLDHPLFVEGKGWSAVVVDGFEEMYGIRVSQLEEGDHCFLLKGDMVSSTILTSITRMKCSEYFYCISTEKYNNFFANSILAHDVNIDKFQLHLLSQEGVMVNRL